MASTMPPHITPRTRPYSRARARLTTCLAVLSVAAGLVAALPARAELQHPRQEWLRHATAGLFLHWGMRTSPGYTSCSAWERAVTDGGWSADYWITEAQKLHAQYIVLATFHSRLGYARPYPSKVPGSCATRRDFLRELIDAGKAKGVKVIHYLTDDPQWHDEGGHEWLDSRAYSRYKGRSVNLHTRDGFGEFSYDIWVENLQRYADLAGVWVDNDNAYWERNGLYERVRRERPDWVLSNNNEDTPIMDTISNEQKSGMTPSYDYPQAVYTAQPRITEACFTIAGRWWYTGSNPTPDRRLTTGRYVTNAGSSIKSLIAEGAMVNGRFPSNQAAFNNFMDGYLDRIWEAFDRTEGGGYLYGGLQPGAWNDGAYGVTTIKKANPNLHYIHVTQRPASGSTLRVRDNGYKVTKVSDLRTGTALDFTQSTSTLTVNGISWDQYDTVLRVETDGQQGYYPQSSIRATASASRSGFPAANLVDGNYLKYWDSDNTTPVSIRLDLGAAKKVGYLAVNQREDSVSYRRSSTEDSARIRDYRVYVSANGTDWGSPVKTGRLRSARGVQFIDLNIASTRHVRLEVVNTWAASSASRFYKRLRIDEVKVAGANAPGGSSASAAAGGAAFPFYADGVHAKPSTVLIG
jgi:alpha-L-fucosidase